MAMSCRRHVGRALDVVRAVQALDERADPPGGSPHRGEQPDRRVGPGALGDQFRDRALEERSDTRGKEGGQAREQVEE